MFDDFVKHFYDEEGDQDVSQLNYHRWNYSIKTTPERGGRIEN